MSLTNTQLVTVSEIVYETFATVESLASSLNAEQETAVIADIALWTTGTSPVRDSAVRVKGGKDGVDFDQERKRELIRRRVRNMLGLPIFSDQLVPGSQDVPVLWRF